MLLFFHVTDEETEAQEVRYCKVTELISGATHTQRVNTAGVLQCLHDIGCLRMEQGGKKEVPKTILCDLT